MKELELTLTIPTTDPQDPGFDVQINYVATRDPTTSEPFTYNNYPFLPLWWQNATSSDSWATYTTNSFWLCANNTSDSMEWWKMVFDTNILSVLDDQGWNINTSRTYDDETTLGFNTSRQVSMTNDTFVILSATLTNTLLTTCTVHIEISNDNSTFSTISSIANLTAAVSSETLSSSFIVPAGYYYKLVTSGSGTITLVSLKELSL